MSPDIDAVHENPYHGATLSPASRQVERLTAVRPTAAFVDRGFKGATHHPGDVSVYVSGRKRLTRTLKALLRRRSAIEPLIGHLKHEHKLERNHLLGKEGDRINVLLTGCGFDLRKLWRFFKTDVSLQPASLSQGRLFTADGRRGSSICLSRRRRAPRRLLMRHADSLAPSPGQ
jgi:hypothetical protein